MKRKSFYYLSLAVILLFTFYPFSIFGKYDGFNLYCNKKDFHPVHISYTNIEFNKEKGKYEILFKIFVDDFDLILKTKYGKDLKLKEGLWEKSYAETINKYIFEHFKLIIGTKDKTKSNLNFLRKEISEGAIWLYYDFSTKEKGNNYEIYNSLMMDLYQDQNNLLIFTYMDQQKAFRFDQSKIKEGFSL
jgi:hypothetical protein